MLKPIIPLVMAAAAFSAHADILAHVSPVPEQLKNLKPVAIAESGVEEQQRLDRIDSIIRRFNLKVDEKFIYAGKEIPFPSLGVLDVVYKVYPEEAQLQVVKLDIKKGMRVSIPSASRISNLIRISPRAPRCQGCQQYSESRCVGGPIQSLFQGLVRHLPVLSGQTRAKSSGKRCL
ncbi:hypothetical protein RHM58_21035 [Pseudomonas sp. 10S4]|uniref:hypothetical protein n=1 Tax=Pseudomonas sp. 10S4 TaxID=3048583 RepID=UPI002AC92D37|nr:hypothetical protein [Pseudomonas sp. 10S4]WPX16494.1 hypothetical protein RHM58_21035 [Pseudomonas sp. 10S4]